MERRPRGGGDAARPARLVAGVAGRRGAGGAARGGRGAGVRGDARLGARAGQHAPPHGRRRGRRAGLAARRPGRRAGAARPARRRLRHASVRPVERGRGLRGRALPLDLRLDARARAARADVRAARPRRGPGRRVGGPRAARAARARPAAAGARGQLAVLAGPRHRPRLRPRADLRHVPAGRHPAQVRQLRRVRRGGRRAAALRRLPRADVPVVGRAAAAEARHDRGADHGRPDARARQRRARRARAVRRAARGDRGIRRRGDRGAARGARREPLPRRARRHAGGAARPRARRPPAGARDPRRAARRLRAARRGARLRGRAGRPPARSPPSPATAASGSSPGSRRARPSGPALGMLVAALAADFSVAAPPLAPRSRAGSAHTP